MIRQLCDVLLSENVWQSATSFLSKYGEKQLGTIVQVDKELYSQDIFLVCFSVVDPESFDNIESKWLKEVDR